MTSPKTRLCSMSDYATPRHEMALAEMLDHESYLLKSGDSNRQKIAAQLRRIADCIERKI